MISGGLQHHSTILRPGLPSVVVERQELANADLEVEGDEGVDPAIGVQQLGRFPQMDFQLRLGRADSTLRGDGGEEWLSQVRGVGLLRARSYIRGQGVRSGGQQGPGSIGIRRSPSGATPGSESRVRLTSAITGCHDCMRHRPFGLAAAVSEQLITKGRANAPDSAHSHPSEFMRIGSVQQYGAMIAGGRLSALVEHAFHTNHRVVRRGVHPTKGEREDSSALSEELG
mmetsp:Transcript_24121/g.48745  ORF Transcript_24121/g.48745 Transcript_24121/m.48745 type:complete len:228 (+) Transcript_24121:2851-3534(+)